MDSGHVGLKRQGRMKETPHLEVSNLVFRQRESHTVQPFRKSGAMEDSCL